MRGNNCNQFTKDVIKQVHKMRDPLHSTILGKKKNEIYPFEDTAFLEKMCKKYDAAFFVVGNNQKKRPNDVIFGRIFNEKAIDIVEFGVSDFEPLKILTEFEYSQTPVLIFQGE